MVRRLLFLLLVVGVVPSEAAPPAQTRWLGFPIVAEARRGTDPAIISVLSAFQVGTVQGDTSLYWRLTPGTTEPMPTTRRWLGMPEVGKAYSGPPLVDYPAPVPWQSRYVDSVQIGLDPDGTVRWRRKKDAPLDTGTPLWLDVILRTGVPSVRDATSASQLVPWPTIELGLDDTTKAQGHVLWRLRRLTP